MLARREIGWLADLAGKRVATGTEGSGTRLTADLDPRPRARWRRRSGWRSAPADALEALLAGEIDAFFYVVGAPAELFRSDGIDPAGSICCR